MLCEFNHRSHSYSVSDTLVNTLLFGALFQPHDPQSKQNNNYDAGYAEQDAEHDDRGVDFVVLHLVGTDRRVCNDLPICIVSGEQNEPAFARLVHFELHGFLQRGIPIYLKPVGYIRSASGLQTTLCG